MNACGSFCCAPTPWTSTARNEAIQYRMRLRNLYYDLLTMQGVLWQRRPWCGPRIAQINISDNCNLNCTICNRAAMGVGGLLDAGKALSLVDELYQLGAQEVFFHGFGEPGLHPQLPELIESVRKKAPGIRLHLITNGTWNSRRLLEALRAARVHVRFSLHAGDIRTWQEMHPHDDPGCFHQAERNLRFLTAADPNLTEVLYVICKSNVHRVRDMVVFARDHGIKVILFRPMRLFKDRAGQFMNAHLMPGEDEFRDAAAIVTECRRELRGTMKVLSVPFEQNCFDPFRGRPSSRDFYLSRSCYIGYVLAVVERDGGVWGCLPESTDGIPLGNIHEKPFRDIWRSAQYDCFRREKLFAVKQALPREGCHTYCQHLDTNLRLNKIRPWRRSGRRSCTGVPE